MTHFVRDDECPYIQAKVNKKMVEWFDGIYRREYHIVSKSSSDSHCNELLNRIREALLEGIKGGKEMKKCDYCGRLIETTEWAHDGDEENICETCLRWMVAHGEVLFEIA